MGISAREQRKYNNLVNIGVFLAFMALSAIIFGFFSPIVITNASTDLATEFDTVINPVASVTLDANAVDFNVTPTASGVFQSKSIVASVNTNSTGGYELYFSSENDSTDMVNADVTDVISSNFEDTVTSSTMPVNSWGYGVDNINFEKIPLASAQAQLANINDFPSSSEREKTVYFGIKINDSLAAGTYLKTVRFSVLAHESKAQFNGITRMQEMTPEICAAASTGDTTTLRDIRDGNTYTVKKLADGRCWMTESLALGGDTAITLTSADSNLPSGTSFTIPVSSISGFNAQDTNNAYIDSTYGGYYTFYTASAGEGGTSKASGDVERSICPKGWRLPTGGSSGEFNTLFDQYNSVSALMGSPGFVHNGFIYDSSTESQGSGGRYWSSTVSTSNKTYTFYFGSSVAYSANYGYDKWSGYSVRCIVPEPVPTMQTFNKSTLTNVGDSISLEDERDGNFYTVKKLADGNVWMTENLRIVNKLLDSTLSDLPAGETFTVPTSSIANFATTPIASAAYIDSTYGGYYNFYTTSAGWGTDSVTSGNSPKSICPKGWRLPTSGENGDFSTLYTQYNSASAMMGEPGFVLSGRILNDSLDAQGTVGSYWSSTVDDGNAYFRGLMSRIVYDGGDDKYGGYSVRCIAR